MTIRNAARAIITKNSSLLLLRYGNPQNNQDEVYYLLPGGGQEYGEPLEATVRRECAEEINVEVEVKNLVYVREYIEQIDHSDNPSTIHQVHFLFFCTISQGEPSVGHVPDINQTGIEWVPFDQLETLNFYPHALRKPLTIWLKSHYTPTHEVYVGAINR